MGYKKVEVQLYSLPRRKLLQQHTVAVGTCGWHGYNVTCAQVRSQKQSFLTQLKAVVGSQSPHFIYALHVEAIDESVQRTSVRPHMLAF